MCLEDLKTREKQIRTVAKETVLLKEMDAGQRGKIIKIKKHSGIHKILSNIGVSSGNIVEIERMASQNDKIDVKVRGYHLSLRTEDAANIAVELHQ